MTQRRRGRPTLEPGQSSSLVALKLPDAMYDEVYRRASSRRESMADVIRRALKDHLRGVSTR
jgi:hypothetical protein